MGRRTEVAALALVVLAVLVGSLATEPVHGAKTAPNVPLRASFRGSVDTGFAPDTPEHYVDKILNDVDRSYETGNGVSAWLTPNGDLFFEVAHHADRSVKVVFPRLWNDTVGWLPDTLGFYGQAEPIDYLLFQTRNSSSYGGHKVDFLTMKHGATASVTVWVDICTISRHHFYTRFSDENSAVTGVVEVAAFNDASDPNETATRWKLYPLPGTADIAYILKRSETGKSAFYPFEGASMPFELTLTKK